MWWVCMRWDIERLSPCTFSVVYQNIMLNVMFPTNPKLVSLMCHIWFGNFIQVLAKKFGAAIVTLEHRYYGKSSPFKSLTTKNLQFLSSKQALYDLAAFRQYYQASYAFNLFNKSNWKGVIKLNMYLLERGC